MKALSQDNTYRFTVFERDGKHLLEIYNRETGSVETYWLPAGQLHWSFETADAAMKFAGAYLASSSPGSSTDPRTYSGDIPDLQWQD